MFNINIFQYIDIGEVILQFIDAIPLLIFSLIVNAIMYIFSIRQTTKIDQLIVELKGLKKGASDFEVKRKKLMRMAWMYLRMALFLIPLVILVVLYVFSSDDNQYFSFSRSLIIFVPAILFLVTINVSNDWLKRKLGFTLSYLARYCFFGLVLYFGAVVNMSFSNGLKIKNDKESNSESIYEFNYKEQKVVTNDSLAFIGRTHNYIFLYDRTKKATKVLEREDVTDFVVIEL